MKGAEAGLPVIACNSFREKGEEPGPWTDSETVSPFFGPSKKGETRDRPGGSLRFQVRTVFSSSYSTRSSSLSSPSRPAPPLAHSPHPAAEGHRPSRYPAVGVRTQPLLGGRQRLGGRSGSSWQGKAEAAPCGCGSCEGSPSKLAWPVPFLSGDRGQ